MSLKKDIMNLVKSDEGNVKVNNITTLRRWTKTALGEDVDRMTATFEYIAGVKGGSVFDIASRDYDGIINELAACTIIYMENCTKYMICNMRNGYR